MNMLTFHSYPPTAMPPIAACPASPINKLLPTLLDIREAPICKQNRLYKNHKKSFCSPHYVLLMPGNVLQATQICRLSWYNFLKLSCFCKLLVKWVNCWTAAVGSSSTLFVCVAFVCIPAIGVHNHGMLIKQQTTLRCWGVPETKSLNGQPGSTLRQCCDWLSLKTTRQKLRDKQGFFSTYLL